MIICDVEFEIPSSPVGVLCSGGADSSLVLYLLMKYSEQPIHIFTLSNKAKNFTNATLLGYIIHWCIKKTNNTNIFHHTYFGQSQTQVELAKYPLLFLQEKTIKTLYIGDTSYPPDDINQLLDPNDVQRSIDRSYGNKREPKIGPFYYPFTNYTKQKIAEIYQAENVMELFPLTRSCETLENIGTQHCGNCWWCKEREWAFGKL